jgi:hypothetical protein
MRSTSTIDKLYDQYKLQDWDINADNLNPKREMLMGQVKQLEKAIQSLTDDIVRKRITPKQEDIETLTTSFGGESTVGNLGKTIASINAGSDDGTIFGEGLPSDVEEQIALLQAELGPVVIDCKKILSKYNFDIVDSEDIDDEDGEHTYVVNTDDIDSSNGPKTNDVLEELNLDGLQNDDCAAADLTILKIFIAILKIFQIIVKILQFLLELPTILAELIELAAMCWINPPSIALLVQIILDLITSLIVALISNLIKFLWDLLGLDCISQQATDLLDNIQDLISKFKNTAALIDIGAVGFMFDGISTQIDNISDLIKKSINDMKEDWNEAVNKVKDYFSEEGLENLKEAAIDAAVNTLQDEYSEAVGGNTNATINKGINDITRSLAHGTIIEDAKNKAIQKYNDMTNAYYSAMETATSTVDNLKESFARMQDSTTKLGELISDVSFGDLEIE